MFDNVFIGSDSNILYNTKIGPNAIIASGSVVVKDVPEGSIVGGNPAKVIGTIDNLIKARKKWSSPGKEQGINNIIDYYWNRRGE